MKNILLSAAVAVVLGLGGCGSDDTTTTPVTTSKALDSVKPITRPAEATYVAAWVKDADIELSIAGGADASKFEIENKTTESILRFKNDITPEYVEGAANEYIVEINAKDLVKDITKKVGTFKVQVPKPTAINDTEAPVITTDSTFHFTDTSSVVTLSATDNVTASDAISFSIPAGSSMFTLSGTTLAPQFNSGTNSIVVTAQDTAGNTATKTITVDVNLTSSTVTPPDSSEIVTIGDLNWTKIHDERKDYNSSFNVCKDYGWRLPTVQEVNARTHDANTSELFALMDADTAQTSMIWTSDAGTVDGDGTPREMAYWFTFNNNGTIENKFTESAQRVESATTFYFTCVKP